MSENETVMFKPLKKRRILRFPPVQIETYREEEIIRGPLGVWPWPILNVILRFIRALRKTQVQPTVPVEKPHRKRMTIHEIIRDERGRIIEIVERETEN